MNKSEEEEEKRGWRQRTEGDETELQLKNRSRSQIIEGTKTQRAKENVAVSKI